MAAAIERQHFIARHALHTGLACLVATEAARRGRGVAALADRVFVIITLEWVTAELAYGTHGQ